MKAWSHKREWSHLPNAHHIDWVIESVKQNDQLWVLANNSMRDTVGNAWHEARNAAWSVVEKNGIEVWSTGASASILVLIAYDDCDQYINMGYEKLRAYAILSEKPQAILLLPMVYVKEKLYQNTLKYNCIL